jgi:hypothetical protein
VITRAYKIISENLSSSCKARSERFLMSWPLFCIYLLLILVLSNSCKKESDVFPDDVSITFKVYDDNDSLVTGAKISIYDNFQSYLNGVASQNTGFSIDSGISQAAGTTFNLKAQTDYWVYVSFDDPVRLLKMSNANISSQLDKFLKSEVINARIKIAPSNANISFWSDLSNQVPITVIFNSITNTLSNTMASAPAGPGNPNALTFSVQPGTYSYYAKGPKNCLWTGQVKIANGAFKAIQLPTCNTGQITFYTTQAATIPNTFPIKIVLDNLDNAGLISTPSSSAYTCGSALDPNALNVYRDPNTYTYVAQTADQRCTWTGTFTLSANGCMSIALPLCP